MQLSQQFFLVLVLTFFRVDSFEDDHYGVQMNFE
jgi:hypothetical protein